MHTENDVSEKSGQQGAEKQATAKIRQQNDYFQVDEQLGFELAGEGEHLYVHIRKDGQNTAWVKDQLALQLKLNPRDIGHAGLKDRYAVTTQWLSIYAPKTQPAVQNIQIDAVQVLQTTRHRQKLKPGMHAGNQFKIRLTEFTGCQEKTDQILNQIKQNGFPNYFGHQRFGRDGANLPKGWQLLQQRKLNRHKKKSIYLSALRSFLFNRVLDAYIGAEIGAEQVAGELKEGDSMRGMSGPLWGRGRLNLPKQQAAFEQSVLEPWLSLCDALEYSGLQQERRELLVVPESLQWVWLESAGNSQLELSFQLPPGSYATSLLNELAQIVDVPHSRNEEQQ